MNSGNFSELLIVWSVRLGLIAYVMSLAESMWAMGSNRGRVTWTVGGLACLAHILLAMHFQHDWRLAAAYAETARQTREIIGLDWGGGIYINFLFAAVWLADAAWWWCSPASRAARGKWLSWAIHGFLAFIIFNATVVFKTGPLRWTALAACLALIMMAAIAVNRARQARRRKESGCLEQPGC